MNRPIAVATIGIIIGIFGGLYLKTSTILIILLCIVGLFYVQNFNNFEIMKLNINQKKHIKNIIRYLKVLLKKSTIIIFICSFLLSIFYTKFRNNIYESIEEKDGVELTGEIQSSYTQNKYTYSYKIRIENKLYILYVKPKKTAKEFEYGDIVKLTGKIELPEESRNYDGFSQRDYYKSKGLYGKIYTSKIEKIGSKFSLGVIASIARNKIKQKVKNYLSESNANILLGILIGDKSEITEEQIDEFRESSLIHILCVSRCTHWVYTPVE